MTATADAPAKVRNETLATFDDLLARPVSMRSMALLRICAGLIALLHLRPLVQDAAAGRIYRDVFHEPYASWYPELPRSIHVAVLWIGVVAAVAMTLGVRARFATATTSLVVTWHLFLSTTHVHNNRAYLVIVLAALAIVPCGRELSIDAWWRRRSGREPLAAASPGWPLWLLRFEAATVYLASGFSKLVDPDWFGGTVTWHRLVQVRERMEASVLPSWAVDVLLNRSVHTVAAKVVVATELFIALGLWSQRTRYAAVWVAVCFHVAIQLSAAVETFSVLAISALVIWAVPSTRDRTLVFDGAVPGQRRLAGVVSRLDWLARFRVEERTDSGPMRVVGRDGRELEGRRAVVFALSRLPLTAWFALPLTCVPRNGKLGRAPSAPLVRSVEGDQSTRGL